jgi:NitT/TauT family transport system substrate-binding protein
VKRSSALALVGATTSLAAAWPMPLRAQSALTKVRAFALPVDPCGALFYAKELGFFEKAGLDVDISTLADYGTVIPAVLSGSADIAYGIIMQLEQAFQKGLPIALIAPAAINDARRPTNFLLVAKDSAIRSPKDLNGKTLGSSPLKSLGTYATDAWINDHDGDATTVKWVDVPFPLCGEAIARGRIDGAFVIEPFATFARAETKLIGRPYESISPYFLGAAYFAPTRWAAAHPDIVRRFALAIAQASKWGNSNPDKSASILAGPTKVDQKTIASMTRAMYAESLTPEIIQPTIDFGVKYKMIDGPFAASDIIFRPSAT